jgi:hypothetical protein
MAKAGGVLLIAAGVAAAVYGLAPRGDADVPELPAEIGLVDTAPVPRTRPAFRPVQESPEPAAAAQPVVPPFSAPVVVTLAQRSEPTSKAAAGPVPRDRDALARELQKELRRVGCYDGELNGAWTQSTRAAMKAFTDRINATLPVDEPDPILFTLVQGQQDRVCGKPCPAGESVSREGRCVPTAILAQSGRKGAPPAPATTLAKAPAQGQVPAVTGWTTTSTAAAPPPALVPVPAPGVLDPQSRMALAGPATEAPPAADPNAAAAPAPATPPAVQRPSQPRSAQRGQRSWAESILRSNVSPN